MSRFALLFATVFFGGWVVAAGADGPDMPNDVKSIVARDRWTVAEGTRDANPIVTRFRSAFKDRPDVRPYPKRIRVTWTYDGGITGMPDAEASRRMGVFEDRIVTAVESDLAAVLTAVITHDGRRDWIFYATDAATFGRRLNQMPQEKERYPIAIEASDDPQWKYLHDQVLAEIDDAKK